MIRAFIRFYLKRTVANWRNLRRACMVHLPKTAKEADIGPATRIDA